MTANRQNGSLFVNIENTIATIEFGHPASNSFPSELLDRLTNELNNISKLENNLKLVCSFPANRHCEGSKGSRMLVFEVCIYVCLCVYVCVYSF